MMLAATALARDLLQPFHNTTDYFGRRPTAAAGESGLFKRGADPSLLDIQ
jgi:hypothetical protein